MLMVGVLVWPGKMGGSGAARVVGQANSLIALLTQTNHC